MSEAIPRLLTAAEVAHALGVTLPAFWHALPDLRAEKGFPMPVLPRRYDPDAITAWLARQRTEAAPFPAASPPPAEPRRPPAEDIDGWQAELDRRLAGLGRATSPG